MKLSKVFWTLSTIIWITTSAFALIIVHDSASISFNYSTRSERYPDYEVEILILNITHKGLLFDAQIYLQVSLLDSESQVILENSTSALVHPGQRKTVILRIKITPEIASSISAYSIRLQLSLIKMITWISYNIETTRAI